MSGSVASQGAADDILETAAQLALRDGVGPLTAREVAQAAAVSPSAVNYHLGGRDGLMASLLTRFRGEAERWRAERRTGIAAARRELLTPAALTAALTAARVEQPSTRMLLEFQQVAADEGSPLTAPLREERVATNAFWREMLRPLGCDEHAVRLWTALSIGATSLAMLDSDPVVRAAWISDVCQRAADRLQGRPLLRRAPSTATPVALPDEPWPEGKRRIVEAAIRVIGEEGVHNLTHRRAAAVAGLSLASTTYFFVNKAEIVFEAFRELHRRTIDQFLTMRTPPPKGLSELLLNADGSMRWDFGAMRALYTSAARDPSLRVLAASLRKDQGYGAERWLTALGIADIDRLDGRLWSFVISGLVDEAMLQPPDQRAAYLDALGERAFGDLFDRPVS